MKIITVSGAYSGIGKTKLVEKILRQFKDWSALKVTVVKNSPCPREIACGVCQEQKTPFSIISNHRIVNQKGKDTQRMKASGAKKVLWLRAKPSGLKKGLEAALKKLKKSPGVVVEGTSVLKYLKPDLGFFIYGKGKIRVTKC
jgi:molybdopterin-guanine dinucleotide biosynthesis protein